MDLNSSQIFKKIELLLVFDEKNQIATTRVEYDDAMMMFTSNHLIIIKSATDEELNVTTTGKLFELNEIAAYKTYHYNK
jgi:hypothetical protein